MKPSPDCYALLKTFEQGPHGGFAPEPYRCPAGYLTIGWGHVIKPGEAFPKPISAEQADALLEQDVAPAANWLSANIPVRLTQSMFDALTCFVFNIGAGAFAGSTLYSRLRAGLYAAAADQFLVWDKARNPKTGKKEPLAGLTRRRHAERGLFLKDGLPP